MTSAVLRLTTFGWAVLSMATGAVWAAVESAQPSIVIDSRRRE
jgi:hypothetical protein